MPNVRTKPTVIAIACSDLHFSHNKPPARDGEADWYAAQQKSWTAMAHNAESYGVPILIAGDIFDRWSPPVELVNFVIGLMARSGAQIYAIPGQHDLPYHRYEERMRSAYGTLISAGVIKDLPPGKRVSLAERVGVTGFPWGHAAPQTRPERQDGFNIALVHRYVWTPGYGYTGAPPEGQLRTVWKDYPGFDWLLFGDNHKGFFRASTDPERPIVVNCGGFMRRTSDEEERQPAFYRLTVDGDDKPGVEVCLIDTDGESFERVGKAAEQKSTEEIKQFVRSLRDASSGTVDFRGAVVRYCNDENPETPVKELLLQAVDQ